MAYIWVERDTGVPYSKRPRVLRIGGRFVKKDVYTDEDFEADGRYTRQEVELTEREKTFADIVAGAWEIICSIYTELEGKATPMEFLDVAEKNGDRNATTASIEAWCAEKGIPFSAKMKEFLYYNTDLLNNKYTWYDLIAALRVKVAAWMREQGLGGENEG